MMKKGLVVTIEKGWQRSDIFFLRHCRFFEFTFMRTSESLPMKRLAELMHTYRNTPEFVQEFFSPGTSRGRALLYSDALPKVKSEVLEFS